MVGVKPQNRQNPENTGNSRSSSANPATRQDFGHLR
jgi:hypothetical protein